MTDNTQQPKRVLADRYTVWIAEKCYEYDIDDESLTPDMIASIRKDANDSDESDIWEETWLVPARTRWTNTPAHNAHESLDRSMRLAQ